MKTQKLDLIVGIPSYNEADSISFVTEQASKGLKKYFPELKTIIVNVDNNSQDGTKEAFLKTPSEIPLKYITTPKGMIGKGNNFRNLFKYMIKANAKAAVVIDADLKSITPEWIRDLATPILKRKKDYVVPIYTRHKYDATITNNLCYPLLYGVVCKNVRQPIAGDFAFSKKLCEHYLNQKWNNTTHHYGIDIFMTLNAVFGKFKIAQVCLGNKIHKPSAPKLGQMFIQVVNTLFSEVLKHKKDWEKINSVDNLGLTGKEKLGDGQDLKVDELIIKRTAIVDYVQHRNTIKRFLSKEVFKEVDKGFKSGNINIGPELWAKTVFDLLSEYEKRKRKIPVIKAMKSLYFGRFYTFMKIAEKWDNLKAEKYFRKQAKIFKKLKPYLLERLG